MIVRLTSFPVKLTSLPYYRNVYIQTISPVDARVSNSYQALATPVFGYDQGLTISQTDRIVRLVWVGDLWAIGDGAIIDIEVV